MDRLLTMQEVAARLAISERAARDLVADGKIAAVNVSRNPKGPKPRYRVPESSLLAFIAERTEGIRRELPKPVRPFDLGTVVDRY